LDILGIIPGVHCTVTLGGSQQEIPLKKEVAPAIGTAGSLHRIGWLYLVAILIVCTEGGRQPGVVIFGTGERGCSVAALLLCHGYQGAIAFCDNNPDRAGKMWQGFPVYTPADAVLRCWDDTFVLPTPGLADAMSSQLTICGLDSGQIVMAPEVWPYELLEMDWDEANFSEVMERN